MYYLAESKNLNSLRNLRKYAININEDIDGLIEYYAYRKAIDKITLSAFFEDKYSLIDAKRAVESYKIIDDYSRKGKIWYGGKENET
ncbi:MAG: hypothetical protein KatS3mg002_0062 [Candidatus Woesearchaeota archaeon]|nr:MAG: hypothetical protein KatS3mg002_0062 [Candidatus Woesearchaeota archaeon]